MAECCSGEGRHARAVEQVSWVDKGPQKEEMLVTCAADGRITTWHHTNKVVCIFCKLAVIGQKAPVCSEPETLKSPVEIQ